MPCSIFQLILTMEQNNTFLVTLIARKVSSQQMGELSVGSRGPGSSLLTSPTKGSSRLVHDSTLSMTGQSCVNHQDSSRLTWAGLEFQFREETFVLDQTCEFNQKLIINQMHHHLGGWCTMSLRALWAVALCLPLGRKVQEWFTFMIRGITCRMKSTKCGGS